jgi:hypothetical protein
MTASDQQLLQKLMKRRTRLTNCTTLIDAVRATVKADLFPEKPFC